MASDIQTVEVLQEEVAKMKLALKTAQQENVTLSTAMQRLMNQIRCESNTMFIPVLTQAFLQEKG
jgi:hypothetical protein